MGVEDHNPSNNIGSEAVGEEVDDEDAGGDGESGAGGVKGEAAVGGEFGGDFMDMVRVRVTSPWSSRSRSGRAKVIKEVMAEGGGKMGGEEEEGAG